MSLISKVLLAGAWLFAAVALVVTLFDKITWLTYLYYFSYIKIGVTLIKYIPQVNMYNKLPCSFHLLSNSRPPVHLTFCSPSPLPLFHPSPLPSEVPLLPSHTPSFLLLSFQLANKNARTMRGGVVKLPVRILTSLPPTILAI